MCPKKINYIAHLLSHSKALYNDKCRKVSSVEEVQAELRDDSQLEFLASKQASNVQLKSRKEKTVGDGKL